VSPIYKQAAYQNYSYYRNNIAERNSEASNTVGRLSITVAQAKLVKNYGMTRMDPYVRLRVGHYVYETQTDPNGGKMPRWNRVIHCQLPSGVNSIYVEIYDECNFTMDELIAWAEIKIPDVVLRGETHEDWYPLSGKQGEGLEGMVDIVFSFTTVTAPSYVYQPVQPVVMVPNVSGRAMPVYVQPQSPVPALQQQTGDIQLSQQIPVVPSPQQQQLPPQPQQPLRVNDDDLKQINEMFPNLDKEVIKSVLIANNCNKDITINSLLQMTNE
jgi:toll-interacting protein